MTTATTTLNIQTRIIDQDYAEELLAKNTHNRKVSGVNLAKIKHSLLRNEWKLNGEAIKVARNGQILDGQHRLLAVAETGVPFETIVITGLDEDTQHTMDTGKSRTLPDVLGLAGFGNTSTLAATLAGVIRFERHGLRSAFQVTSAHPVSVTEAMDRLYTEPTLEDLARDTKKFGRVGLPGRLASVLYYAFSAIDSTDTDYFFEKLYAGDELERGNPIFALRNQLLSLKTSRGQSNPAYMAAITVKAWNKYREGSTATLLRWSPGGATPEAFPEAK